MWVQVILVAAALRAVAGLEWEEREKIVFPRLTNNVEFSETEICTAQNRLYQEHLQNLTLWAHEMWDASAKYTTGVLRGNLFQMGDWDECVTIDGPYQTQYCLATLEANLPTSTPREDPLSLYFSPFESVLNRIYKTEEVSTQSRHAVQIGLCIPASCSPRDLEESLNEHLSKDAYPLKELNVSYSAKVSEKLCQTEIERNTFDPWDIAFCFLALLLILLVILSSFYDYCQSEEIVSVKKPAKKSLSQKMFMAFSITKNFCDLPRADESNPALSILYGLRTFSIFMIIMDHRFGTYISGPIMNVNYIEEQYRSKFAAFIFHGDLFVDTFFVLSGLLVTYGLLVQFDKKVINPVFLIFLRYIRLTPVYAFVILYYASMFNHIGSGPLWKLIVGPEVADCRENWWTNLLYINNYVNDENMCMVHAWYLPCDFHYFIIGIFVTMLIKKRKNVGLGVLVFLFLLSVVIPFAITVIYLRPALLQFYPSALTAPKRHTDFKMTYTKSHTRIVAYIIGMFVGYIYYRLKGTSKRMSRISSHVLTLVSFLLIFLCIATGAVFYNRYHEYNAIESGAYAALHRVAWAAGTAGLLFSASYGHATILRSVLSWSPWVPLSKLVYGAYLVHMTFQFRSVAMTTSPKYFTYFDVISFALGDIVLAFTSALFLYLGIEAPLRKIFKELLMPARSPQVKSTSEATNEENTVRPNHDSRL